MVRGDMMGEDIITTYQKTILEFLADQGKGLTRDEICQCNMEKKLGIPASELDSILESLEFRNFIYLKKGEGKKWHVTMRGLCAVGKGTECPWP
jgi:hypothetical protein